jgi:hypothetical protein
MNVTIKILGSIVIVFGILTGIAVLLVQSMPETKEVSEFNKKFKVVQIGDSETKTISVLGNPDAKEKEFRIGQKQGFEDAYARAKASDSVYYLLWFRGIDVVFTVGINDKGYVSAKESGGT